jgi:site-specific DNA-cytosine methylase
VDDAIDTIVAAEPDTDRQTYMLNSKFCSSRSPQCILNTVADLATQRGPCARHGQECRIHIHPRFDFVTLSPMCPPFSRKGSKAIDSASSHKDFHSFWVDAYNVICLYFPRGGVIEEVVGFDHKKSSGLSWCDEFCAKLVALGYSVVVKRANGTAWCKVPRDRLLRTCGGGLVILNVNSSFCRHARLFRKLFNHVAWLIV